MARVRIRNRVVVDRPVEEVFQYLSNFRLHSEWDEASKAFLCTPGPVELGSVFEKHDLCDGITGTALGAVRLRTTRIITRTVTQLERDRRLEYEIRGENGLMHRSEYFELEAVPGGTLVTKGTDLIYPALSNKFLWLTLFVPVVWPFIIINLFWLPTTVFGIKMELSTMLNRIKKRLENRQWNEAASPSEIEPLVRVGTTKAPT